LNGKFCLNCYEPCYSSVSVEEEWECPNCQELIGPPIVEKAKKGLEERGKLTNLTLIELAELKSYYNKGYKSLGKKLNHYVANLPSQREKRR